MYMMEGVSRWNTNRAQEALDMASTSRTKIYDARPISFLDDISQRVLGHTVLPEFVRPGKPTGQILKKSAFTAILVVMIQVPSFVFSLYLCIAGYS